jgi:hypothetical protein
MFLGRLMLAPPNIPLQTELPIPKGFFILGCLIPGNRLSQILFPSGMVSSDVLPIVPMAMGITLWGLFLQ